MVSSDKWKFGGLLTLLLLVPFSPAIAAPANAASTEASFTVLWSFSTPPGGLASNPALFAPVQGGPRYGTTLLGGDFQRGSVYELIPPSLPTAPGARACCGASAARMVHFLTRAWLTWGRAAGCVRSAARLLLVGPGTRALFSTMPRSIVALTPPSPLSAQRAPARYSS